MLFRSPNRATLLTPQQAELLSTRLPPIPASATAIVFPRSPPRRRARSSGHRALALTGEPIDAPTALDWGMVNAVVPDEQLDAEVDDLLARATRGSPASKALGKRTLYAQLDRPEADAYDIAIPVMAATAQSPAAREGRAAFLGKRPPSWPE